jgi:hypothetical protein
VGNGRSREGFDLRFLKPYGTVYGCNLLFTEYPNFEIPDFTVSIEDYRKEMIREAGFPEDRCIFPPEHEQYELEGYNGPSSIRSNAGMNAMAEAIKAGNTRLYLLGFDFMYNSIQSISNMFDGDKKVRTTMTDSQKRCHYFDWYARDNPNIHFRFVFDELHEGFHQLSATNADGIFYNTLMKELEND